MPASTSFTPGPQPADDIPEAPPPALRDRYLRISWAYIHWCIGMLVWTLLCVGYFIVTRQMIEMGIGLSLGLLLLALILFPAALFGGETWYKRLGWISILTGLFGLMFLYPITVVAWGIWKRFDTGRYANTPSFNDMWHLLLSLLTLIVMAWTILLAIRCWKLVRTLQRGDYPPG